MGFRSLLEINHDTVANRIDASFVVNLQRYISSGSSADALLLDTNHDVRVVGMRHSADQYYISASQYGFPSRLPWEDHQKFRNTALEKAKELAGKKTVSRDQLKDTILELITIIERQNEALGE